MNTDWERMAADAVANAAQNAQATIQCAVASYEAPSAIYRPALSIDGNHWCALYGENLMEGVAGFGDSPALAMAAFDKAWNEKLKATDAGAEGKTHG